MPFMSSFSNTGKAKATFPGQAGTPSVTSQSSGQVGLSWTAPAFSGGAPIIDYKIEYSSNGGSTWTEWSHTPSTATSATVTGIPDYLTYIFRVSAKNAVGNGAASGNSGQALQFNAGSGGTEQTISNYNGTGQTWKVHTFTANSSFTMSRKVTDSSLLVVGGGGAGSIGVCGTGQMECAGSGGGGGGYYMSTTAQIPVTSHSVTIGGGGGASGGAGGSTVFGTIQTSTGAPSHGGQTGGSGGTPNGITGGNNNSGNVSYYTSNITGTGTNYAAGGSGYYGSQVTYYGSGGKAAQRNGGDYPDGTGFNGTGGIVVVAYRIA